MFEEADVLLQAMEVGEWCHHSVEVDHIVPDEDVVRDGRPSLQCLDKLASRLVVGQGHLSLAVDVAKHDVHVLQRSSLLWRFHGEEVGECRKLLVWEPLSQLVQESYVVA